MKKYIKVREKKNEVFKTRTSGQWLETINSIIILACLITFIFFDVDFKLIFIVINIAWFFFAVGVNAVAKSEIFLKFLNKYSDNDDFPEDF